jgi:hypothetical protein
VIRDAVAAGRSLDTALDEVRRNASMLGPCAREIEGRGA